MVKPPGQAIRFVLFAIVSAFLLAGIQPAQKTGAAAIIAAAPAALTPLEERAGPPEPDDPLPGNEMPGMVPTPDRLAQPTLSANPTQADLGGQVYYQVCMACHGDQGQGLTPEWLEAWGLEKNSCWESKCHASNHPPEGFELPKAIPPVVGPIIPARFETALDLHHFLKAEMPWQAPGTLEEQEYWQLTAYLLRLNGLDQGSLSLDEKTAAGIRLRPALETEQSGIGTAVWAWTGGGIALLTLLLGILLVKFKKNINTL